MAKFRTQIWQFWKSPRISKTSARRPKIRSILTPWGRKWVYVEHWPMAKFHVQIWHFWKLARISETAARRAKIILNFDPLGWKEVIHATSGTLTNGQVSCANMAVLKIGPYLPGTLVNGQVCSQLECQGPWASCSGPCYSATCTQTIVTKCEHYNNMASNVNQGSTELT